ncbi:hypothetical protein Ais01nite_23920 [Asanoa ishikariensis]|nr:hypothetical protein Ais01nite_23920 [Asanoa ishikariensis]
MARAELPAKLNVTVVPGLAASKSLPICVNDPVSDAAANTVIGPDTALGLALAPVAAVLALSLPHAVRLATVTAARTMLVQRARTDTSLVSGIADAMANQA